MATSTRTKTDICNMALRLLGTGPVTTAQLAAAVGNNREADICNQFYQEALDGTLYDHPWNFAMVRTILYAYLEPAGTLTPGAGATVNGTTGVTFTASGTPFTSLAVDQNKVLARDGGLGTAIITGFTSTQIVTATITQAFANVSALATGSWRIYYAAPSGSDFSFSIPVPTDCLRIWRTEQGERYQVEQSYIVSDQDALTLRYIKQVSDTTLFTTTFTMALANRLAAEMAEPITGQVAKHDRFWNQYSLWLRRARTTDGMEGTPEQLRSRELINVRFGGGGRTRTGWRWWE